MGTSSMRAAKIVAYLPLAQGFAGTQVDDVKFSFEAFPTTHHVPKANDASGADAYEQNPREVSALEKEAASDPQAKQRGTQGVGKYTKHGEGMFKMNNQRGTKSLVD